MNGIIMKEGNLYMNIQFIKNKLLQSQQEASLQKGSIKKISLQNLQKQKRKKLIRKKLKQISKYKATKKRNIHTIKQTKLKKKEYLKDYFIQNLKIVRTVKQENNSHTDKVENEEDIQNNQQQKVNRKVVEKKKGRKEKQMASSSSKNENNSSANAAKLSLFHPKSNEQQTNSQSVIPPSPGKPNKQTSSAEDEGNNDNSNSQSNNEKVSNKTSGRWTKDEHKKFIEGIQKYGRNWKKVEEHIGTRTGAQIRSHAQKFFNRLEKEAQNSAKVSDQSRQLLEIMNNSSHHHNSSSNQNTSSASSSAKQAANQTTTTAQNSSNEKAISQEKEKKPSQNLNSISTSNNNNNNNNNINNTNNLNSTHVHTNITDSPNSIHPVSAQQNLLNQSSISLGNNDNFTTSSNNYKKVQDSSDIMKQLMTSNNSNKYQTLDDYTIHDYLKDDSNETLDYNGNISNNQLKMLYEQAIKIPSYNQSSQYQSYFPSKFSNNNSHINLSSSYNNNSNHSSHNNSHNSHISHGSPIPYSNYNNHYNNYGSNYGYNQNNNMNLYGSNNHYSYQQMKNIYDERDSEEIMEKYTRQIQENSAQENSFFIEHHLADIEKPRLYDMCALGQQDLCSNQPNYQSEIYVPNFKKGRSRFGSFKLHDEENESSNQKYQNFRKASIDDQELKKKLKLNDGTSGFITNSNKLSPDSQVLN